MGHLGQQSMKHLSQRWAHFPNTIDQPGQKLYEEIEVIVGNFDRGKILTDRVNEGPIGFICVMSSDCPR